MYGLCLCFAIKVFAFRAFFIVPISWSMLVIPARNVLALVSLPTRGARPRQQHIWCTYTLCVWNYRSQTVLNKGFFFKLSEEICMQISSACHYDTTSGW